MAATNYTPISLYYSTTASAVPSAGNLVNGELAINITDKKLYTKDNTGAVFMLASAASSAGTVSTVSVATANGFAGTVADASTTPAITIQTSVSGLLKGNGTAVSAATANTDYLTPPSGTSILKAASGGALANAVAGTDYVAPNGALATPSSGTLTNCTVDGTNAIGYRSIPPVGTKTSSYTLTTADVGKYVQISTGGSIVIPDATFSEGNAISLFNNTSGSITVTCSITTAYIAGTDADKATVTLATRGVANILFISGTVCVITGNVT